MVWCQEEPKIKAHGHSGTEYRVGFEWMKLLKEIYIGRPASALPATGLASQHKEQQKLLVDEALGGNKND